MTAGRLRPQRQSATSRYYCIFKYCLAAVQYIFPVIIKTHIDSVVTAHRTAQGRMASSHQFTNNYTVAASKKTILNLNKKYVSTCVCQILSIIRPIIVFISAYARTDFSAYRIFFLNCYFFWTIVKI